MHFKDIYYAAMLLYLRDWGDNAIVLNERGGDIKLLNYIFTLSRVIII